MTATSAVRPISNYADGDDDMTLPEFHHPHHRVLEAYERLGYARDLVGGWAISENDVEDFVTLLAQNKPKKILEVGTYVGVSALLAALICNDAVIFTVDPDFPLNVEMTAVNAGAGAENFTETTQAIGKKAAELLDVADRIHFVKGGFAVSATFDSKLRAGGAETVIVGPDLCKKEGPFDFIFVDGLHTADAVKKDLLLAETALADDGLMVLHDCIGFWGANVRAGVFEFLSARPQYRFLHAPYKEVYKSIGVITKRRDADFNEGAFRDAGPLAPELRSLFEKLTQNVFGPGAVVELIVDSAQRSAGASSRAEIGTPFRFASVADDGRAKDLACAVTAGDPAGMFSADIADRADDDVLKAVFAAVKSSGKPLLLAATPPGERGVAGPYSRPLARIIDLVEAAGCFAFCAPALDLEPARYAMLPEPRALGQSSLYASIIFVSANSAFANADGEPFVRLPPAAAAEQEQIDLQRVHLSCGFRRQHQQNIRDSEMLRVEAREQRRSAENEQRIRFEIEAQLTGELERALAELEKTRKVYAEALARAQNEHDIRMRAVEELTARLDAKDRETQQTNAVLLAEKQRYDDCFRRLIDAYETLDAVDRETSELINRLSDRARTSA